VPQAPDGKRVSMATVLARPPRSGGARSSATMSFGMTRVHMGLGELTFLALAAGKRGGGCMAPRW
jgi:hypothetical protein